MDIQSGYKWPFVVAGAALWAVSGAASADSTWSTGNCTGGLKTCSSTAGGVTMTATAYSADSDSTKFSNTNGAYTTLEKWTGGIGIISSDPGNGDESSDSFQPDHAIDNDPVPGADYSEMVHLRFTTAVDLSSVTAGWTHTDSDAMIFRWNDAIDPTVTNYSPSQLPSSLNGTSSGWSLVAHSQFAAGANSSGDHSIGITNTAYSSHWLVSTAFLGALDGIDGFKLKSFTGCANGDPTCTPGGGGGVPEPSSIALAALALVGVARSRRVRRAEST